MTVPGGNRFKLGLKTGVSTVVGRDALLLNNYLVDPLPPWNEPDDFTSGITDWGGYLGNDQFGNCVPCADVSLGVVDSVIAKEAPSGAPPWPLDTAVEGAYFAYGLSQGEPGPQPDEGCDLGSWLLWRLEHPVGPIPALGGFAQAPIGGLAFQSAFHAFGGGLAAVNISQEAMNEAETDPPQPWTSIATDWIGAHGIALLQRGVGWGHARTWGFLQPFTWAWWRACRQQFFVLFTEEQMSTPGGVFHGIQVAQLRADITVLKGSLE